jgi:high frequency lysogenization protein
MQKYVLNMILIQKNINKISDLKISIRKKIDNYQENSMMATNLSDLIAYTEEIYTEYIGIIRPRVVVSGKKEYLEKNSSLIRALLLSGIRASFLWNHYGGSKWQLMFRRKEILNKCENFFI